MEEEEPMPMGHSNAGGDEGGDGSGAGGRSTRLRLVRELRAARPYASGRVMEQEVELIQQRLMSGHILSEGELELLRASGRGAGAAE